MLVGDTVRRMMGPWSRATHALLSHLEKVGFVESPRLVGMDEQGREMLTYIEGETVGDTTPWPEWAWCEGTVLEVASLLRRYHAAVADFRPSELQCRLARTRMTDEQVVCHNDVAPYNIVYRGGRIAGLIDWDVASPAAPEWDLAFAAWQFVPLHHADLASRLGVDATADRSHRLRLLCDGYGLERRDGFVDLIVERIEASIEGIQNKARAGDEAFASLLAAGHVEDMVKSSDLIRYLRDDLQKAIST
ncbi:phosphotransferase [soil metagenome]